MAYFTWEGGMGLQLGFEQSKNAQHQSHSNGRGANGCYGMPISLVQLMQKLDRYAAS
jgi:hypothetical protein